MNKKQERELVFWAGVLRTALFKDPDDTRSIRKILSSIAELELVFPDGKKQKVSLRTLQRKVRRFRESQSQGLLRGIRKDQGSIRKDRVEKLTEAENLKRESPHLSVREINHMLYMQGSIGIPKSTLYRHFLFKGLTRNALGLNTSPVRVRWTRNNTHDMWVGDFQDGPKVFDGKQFVKTWLTAFIDVHSRFVVSAFYRTRCNMQVLEENLIDAWGRHGLPLELYIDNAKVYRSPRLQHACLELGIHLRYRPKGDPPAGGIVERFFKTSQESFELDLKAQRKVFTLEYLNEGFEAWLNEYYHTQEHEGPKECPINAYKSGICRPIELIEKDSVRKYFLKRDPRKVNAEFSDVSIKNTFFRVDKSLRGLRVIVAYDTHGSFESVEIESMHGQPLGQGIKHFRDTAEDDEAYVVHEKDPKKSFVELLVKKRRDRLEKYETQKQNAYTPHWSFNVFLTKICRTCGLAGRSSFCEEELSLLKKIWETLPEMNQTLLHKAWMASERKGLCELIQIIIDSMEKN